MIVYEYFFIYMSNKSLIFGIIVAALVIGFGVIMYRGRPVMQLNTTQTTPTTQMNGSSPATTTASATTTQGANGQPNTFIFADVQAHNTPSSCWSAIGGDVYDLTSWINRHPGGPQAIQSLCGTDGTDAYEGQHGGQKRPRSVLVMLKIGTLVRN